MNKALLCVVQSNWPQRISYVTTMYHDIFNSISLWRSQYLLQRNYINKKKTEPGSGKNQMPRMQNVRHLPSIPLSKICPCQPEDEVILMMVIIMVIKLWWWSNDDDDQMMLIWSSSSSSSSDLPPWEWEDCHLHLHRHLQREGSLIMIMINPGPHYMTNTNQNHKNISTVWMFCVLEVSIILLLWSLQLLNLKQ